jgi:hypothetical protein
MHNTLQERRLGGDEEAMGKGKMIDSIGETESDSCLDPVIIGAEILEKLK